MCSDYTILSDPQAHTHCLPDPETLNVGVWVRCDAPRLQDGKMKPCGAEFYVIERGRGKNKRKELCEHKYLW